METNVSPASRIAKHAVATIPARLAKVLRDPVLMEKTVSFVLRQFACTALQIIHVPAAKTT